MKRLLCFMLVLVPFFVTAQSNYWNTIGLTYYPCNSVLPTTVRNTAVLDQNGDVWIGFRNAGIGKFSNGSWTFFDTTNSYLPSNTVYSICPSGNDVWSGTNKGAALMNSTGWTRYNRSNSGLPSDTVYAIYHTATDTWFGTCKGVARLNSSGWTTYTRSNSSLLSDTVYCFCMDGSGRLLIGTQKGLNALDFSSNSMSTFVDNQNQPFQQHVGVLFFEPGKGETWISTTLPLSNVGSVYRLLNNVIYPLDAFIDLHAFGSPSGVTSFVSPAPGVVQFSAQLMPASRLLTISSGNVVHATPSLWGAYLLFDASTHRYFVCKKASYWTQHQFFAQYDPKRVQPYIDGDLYDYDNVRLLDVNQVSAAITNRGELHGGYLLGALGSLYQVPKGSGKGTVDHTELWMAGLDASNTVHAAAMNVRMNNGDFFPGPLDTITTTTDSATAEQFDYVWKIDKTKIRDFQYHFANGDVQNGSYVPDNDILTWPAHGTDNYTRKLAPFVDVNNNGVYDPLTGGDYPEIRGDQMLYAIFNDVLAPHEFGQLQLGVEVHLSAYAYECPTAANGDTVVNYTTYYHYDIFNRSANTYHDMRLGVLEDGALGYYNNDYTGCAPSANIGFTYNGTANDGMSAPATYGAQPPISSVLILDGPEADPNDGIDNDNDGTTDEAGEHNRMTGFLYYENTSNPVNGIPMSSDDFYHYLHSTWLDGTPVTYGGNGHSGVTPTRFMYDGLPFDTSAWNETSLSYVYGDRRFVMSCGPFTFQPQSETHFDFAIIYSRDMVNPWGTSAYVNTMLNDVQRVENWYQTNTAPSCMEWNVGVPEQQTETNNLVLYPNPATAQVTLAYQPQSKMANYALIDLTGRTVNSGPINPQGVTPLIVDQLPDGVYFVRVNDGEQFITEKFVKR